MLVQALTAFAENKLQKQLDNVAFEERPVPYFLQIDSAGRFVAMEPRFAAVPSRAKAKPGKAPPAAKQRAMDYSVPRSPVTLTSGTYALLGLGELKYVLGAGTWTEPKHEGRDNERMQAFVNRLREAHQATQDEAIAAALRFYSSVTELEKARMAFREALPGSYLALSVDGQVLTDREPVQRWWVRFFDQVSSARAEVLGECLITGKIGPIAPTHPQIKYTTNIGGKAGVALMSFNAPAFLSYGWEQNANSPVSADAALKYTMALNEMLRPGSPYRKDDGGVAYLFWLQNDAALNPVDLVQQDGSADRISEVRRVLERDKSAWIAEDNLFHLVALSANGSRLIVRSSLTELLPEAVSNVIGWWEGLQMQPLDPNLPLSAPAFWQLKFALERKGEPSGDLITSLWNRALAGIRRPLGTRVMQAVLGRMRVDKTKRLDLAAVGLLRLSVNDYFETQGKERPMPAALDERNLIRHPAYVCGRLLALHDRLQYKTFDLAGEAQPHTTVADRFYTLVMNSPSIGMAKVYDLGRKHLAKLRRLPKRPPRLPKGGAPIAFAYEQLIASIGKPLLGDIPVHFGLQDKTQFALGFYYQKAYRPAKNTSATSAADDVIAEDLVSVDQLPTDQLSIDQPESIETQSVDPETDFFEEI